MLWALGGIVCLVIAAFLVANGVNDLKGRERAEAGPTPEEYWDSHNQKYGPGADGPRMTGPRRPDQYNPEGYFVGAAALAIVGVILLLVG